MPRKGFAGAAVPTTLGAAILSTDTSFTIASATGWVFTNGGGPFVVVIDRGTAQEEKVLCSGIVGTTVTVAAGGRGYDGTTAFGHSLGATTLHVLDSVTIDENNAHTNLTTRDDHTQYLRTDGTRATTGVMTFGARVVAGAGADVTGSASGYLDEVRFTGSGGLHDHTISTTETGTPVMQFHHRGAGNTGWWNWHNGTGATTAVMSLDSTGLLSLPLSTSKIGVGISPTYGVDVAGELRVGGTAHNRVMADDYQSAAAGFMTFREGLRNVDGSATAPAYAFTNNTDMGMFRASAGVLAWAVPSTGWFSFRNSLGAEVAKVFDTGLISAGNGLDVRAGPTGYGNGEIRFGGGDSTSLVGGNGFAITDNFTGSPRMYFDHRGTGNTGDFFWRNGTTAANTLMSLAGDGTLALNGKGFNIAATNTGVTPFYVNAPSGHATSILDLAVNGTVQVRVDQSAQISAIGPTHKFGRGALGGALPYVAIGDQNNGGGTVINSEGSGTNYDIALRAKGVGGVLVQNPGGTVNLAGFYTPANDGDSAMYLYIRVSAGVYTQKTLVQGPADSGGTGFRMVRVVN